MQINLRNIFSRMQPTQQDIQTLSGVIMSIAEGRKGPARGGILDNDEAGALRALLASHPDQTRSTDAPVRGLAKFLRRNPTDPERALWDALTKDRRFAGLFKRATPIGPHINDFVSFQQRLVIDVVPIEESAERAKARSEKATWLEERGYRVVAIKQADLDRDLPAVLDSLAAALSGPL
jgi:tRNA/rRNA methyltransferase